MMVVASIAPFGRTNVAYSQNKGVPLAYIQRFGRMALMWLVAAALLCSTAIAWPQAALADPADETQAKVDQAQESLNSAEARMAEINEEYDAIAARVAKLQKRIDKTAKKALKAQQAMLEGREALEAVAVGEYRENSAATLVSLVLDSRNFDDLLRNMEYVTQVMTYQSDQINEQRKRKEKFDAISAELNEQKNEQEAELAAQAAKREEAETLVAEASDRLEGAKTEHAQRLAELAAQAEALRKKQEAANKRSEKPVDPNANTVDRELVVSDDLPVVDNPDPNAPGVDKGNDASDDDKSSGKSDEADKPASDKPAGDSSASENEPAAEEKPSASNDDGWKTGVASAYGGSTDPTTPNPGTTATGAVCNDTSMGVAVPMSLSGYRKLFGCTVEISYGGKTVYATVNDCGSMGGGSRVLDLQPGVWKAFGFSSCQAWGLRTVSYRFL